MAIALCLAPEVAHGALWDALPLAGLMRCALERLTDEALRLRADALRQRLFIDEQTIAIERGEDLELVVRYAATVEVLFERTGSGLLGARRSAAYLLHATGYLAEHDPDLAIALGELGAQDGAAERALAVSVKAMRRFGREAFEAALKDTPSAMALAQGGRLALREGEPMRAAERFMAAAGKEALPRFAVDACEALLMVDRPEATALCQRLEARFTTAYPASAGRFAEVRRQVDDRSRSAAFARRALETTGRLEELSAEIWRRLRLGNEGAARRLAQVLCERFPSDASAMRTAADVAVKVGSAADLERVLAGAEVAGFGNDPRLGQARGALAVARAIKLIQGEGQPGRIDHAAIATLTTGHGELARQLRVVAALAAAVETEGTGGVDLAVADLLAGEGLVGVTITSARLALIAALVSRRWDAGAGAVLKSVTGSAGHDELAGLVAQIDLGLALQTRDAQRLERASVQIEKGTGPAIELARLVARRAREVLLGGPLQTAGLGADRATLSELAFAFDEATEAGRALAAARAFTLATLELRAGRMTEAAELFTEARRHGGELAPLAAGFPQLLLGDLAGGLELCQRGRASRGPIGQALRVCQALGSPEAEARQRWGEVDLGWDEAHLPPRLEPGTARPLSLVTFALGVRFEAQRPLALTVGLDAVSLLAPELAPARAEVRRRAR